MFYPSFRTVIRCFLRNAYIMGMAFTEAGAGDFDKLGFFIHGLNIRRAAVAHGRAETADKLEEHIGHMALVGDLPFDAFRHQLLAFCWKYRSLLPACMAPREPMPR